MIEINNILDVEKHIKDIEVVIFDLDDTLYSEKEYVKSGYNSIAKAYSNIKDLDKQLWDAFVNKKPALDSVLATNNMLKEKDNWLNIYRFHKPNIHLYPGVLEMVLRIKKSKKVGIITDGRVEGQKAKIESLHLNDLINKIIITDELGGVAFRKPNPKAFQLMKEYFDVEYEKMCYVGDNISKDGIAPEKLGMRFIHFNNKDGLYK